MIYYFLISAALIKNLIQFVSQKIEMNFHAHLFMLIIIHFKQINQFFLM